MKKNLLILSFLGFIGISLHSQNQYQLTWSDEFDGKTIDTNNWYHETGAHGYGNNELQNYTQGINTIVSNGTLKIIAKHEGRTQKAGDFTSSRLLSKKSFTYGRYEIRAKIPENKGNGLWPAIWMLGTNIKEIGWPNCGEIDIMEYVSYAPDTIYFTVHSSANNHKKGTEITSGSVFLPTVEEAFHKYGVTWTETYLEFYIDDTTNVKLKVDRPINYNQDNWPFNKPFIFLLNMAVGGDWGGLYGVDTTIFPTTFEVDYVRVYQKQ